MVVAEETVAVTAEGLKEEVKEPAMEAKAEMVDETEEQRKARLFAELE